MASASRLASRIAPPPLPAAPRAINDGQTPMGPESFRKARPYRAWHRVLVLVIGRLWRLLRVGHVGLRAFHHRLSKRSQFSKTIYCFDSAGKEARVIGKLFFCNLFLCCRKDAAVQQPFDRAMH